MKRKTKLYLVSWVSRHSGEIVYDWWTMEPCSDGTVVVETREIEWEEPAFSKVSPLLIASLEDERAAVRAKAAADITVLDNRIAELLAIGYEGAA